jgi:hypothetical protein
MIGEPSEVEVSVYQPIARSAADAVSMVRQTRVPET